MTSADSSLARLVKPAPRLDADMLVHLKEDVNDDDLYNFDLLLCLHCALSIIVLIFDRVARHCVLLTSCIFCLLHTLTLSSVTFINQKIWRAVINIDESFKFRHG